MGRAQYDWLIVGAGFTGAVVAERIASELDQRVLLIDRRDHIGGNAYDATDEHGVLVHHYGPHIFHTNSQKVWDYLSRFTEWRPYFHRVLGVIDGHLAPIPFNLNSLYQLFPPRLAGRLEEALIEGFGFGNKVPILIVDVTAREFFGEGYEDCDRRIPDVRKARELLDWEPRWSLDDLITSTMDAYVSEYRGRASQRPRLTAVRTAAEESGARR
jgi:choline dehydrogenase-like flavoprotein